MKAAGGQRGVEGEKEVDGGHAFGGRQVVCDWEMKGQLEGAHLPPSVAVLVVFLDDFDGLTDFKVNLIFVFW